MTLNLDPTRTWSTSTENNGTYFNSEFERIYNNLTELAGDENPGASLKDIHTVIKHRSWGDKRQTILSGKTNDNGQADFLYQVTGQNSIAIDVTTEPVILSLSAGYDEWGSAEYTVKIQGDNDIVPTGWQNINTAGRYFLYVDVDEDTREVISYSYTDKLPIYSHTKPTEADPVDPVDPIDPLIGKYWFDLNRFKMMEYTGDTSEPWLPVIRLFVGEVKVEETGITEIITYAIRGEYSFPWMEVAKNSKYVLWHNIGTTNISCDVYLNDNVSGERENDEESLRYCDYHYYGNDGTSGMGASKRIQRNSVIIGIGSEYVGFYHSSGDHLVNTAYSNIGDYRVRVKRTF